MNNAFGFELYQKLYHNDIRRKEDVIILFVHWYFTKNGFRCIGIGDEIAFDASQKGSELLPTEWNSRPNYALRYVRDGKLHILLGVKSDADLLLNLMRHHDNSVFNIPLSIEETISALYGPLETIMPSYQTVLQNIRNDFVSPVCFNDTGTQTTVSSNERSSEINVVPGHNDHNNPLRVGPSHQPPNRVEYDPARVGVRDLDPLGDGSGMIFDPFSGRRRLYGRMPAGLGVPGVLPPNAIPPGARFDPFGPPDIDPSRPSRRRPDDDHLPLPGGYHDMFL